MSLNSAGFNLARALGPALGGLAIAAFTHADTGEACTFLLNSLSFVGSSSFSTSGSGSRSSRARCR